MVVQRRLPRLPGEKRGCEREKALQGGREAGRRAVRRRSAREGDAMSYQKGDLKLTLDMPCTHLECAGDVECIFTGERLWVCDSREKGYRHDDPARPPYEKHGAYLPHSCDQWYIGGRAEVEAIISDLQDALGVMK